MSAWALWRHSRFVTDRVSGPSSQGSLDGRLSVFERAFVGLCPLVANEFHSTIQHCKAVYGFTSTRTCVIIILNTQCT